MSSTVARQFPRPLHPAHAFFVAAAFTPFLGAALSDYTYTVSYQVQWLNFSSWLLAGGLVFAAFALVCALADVLRAGRGATRVSLYFLLLLATWVLGFIDALVHAGDAWATMPTGLTLSVIVVILAVIAAWMAFAGWRAGGAA